MKRSEHITQLCLLAICCLTLAGICAGKKAIAVFQENIPEEPASLVVIDAGHGGEDGGAISCTGRMESEYNLNIALRLNDLLRLLGCQTIMTRKTDTAIYKKGETLAQKKIEDLKERVRIANGSSKHILISIHQNFFPQGQYHGAQVFYAENEESRFLANQLQNSLVSSLNPGSSRKEKSGKGIYLLEKRNGCGVLIECGFLSNAQEEFLLRQPDYQKRLASVIGATVAGNLP